MYLGKTTNTNFSRVESESKMGGNPKPSTRRPPMSLRPQDLDQVPTETAEVARAVFPKGHAYLTLRDKFGALFADELFRKLFAWRGQPAEAPGRLAVVTVLQFAEGLSDQQAADAVRSRLDWKYLLALE